MFGAALPYPNLGLVLHQPFGWLQFCDLQPRVVVDHNYAVVGFCPKPDILEVT